MDVTLHAVDLTQWQEVYKKLAKQAYEGKIDPRDLNADLIRQTYQELGTGAAKGYGKGFQVIGDDGKPNDAVIRMRRNLFRFSGAKSYAQLVELNEKLEKDGKVRPWDEFLAEALALNERYNVNHLQAEYQTAKQAGYHAANWEVYVRDQERFPNLKYKTQGDDRVRDEHRQLDGIIAPIDSTFWARYYPPNGWRCRCYVVQSAEKPSKDIPDEVPEVKQEFRLNVGIGGQVFKEDGKNAAPYFALAREADLEGAFEGTKLYAPYEVAHKGKGGAKVEVSIFADIADLGENFGVARLLADELGVASRIRPHVNLPKHKNPEFEIEGLRGDRIRPKSRNGARAAANAFDDKLGKKGQLREEEKTFLIIDLSFKLSAGNVQAFTRQAWARFKHYQKVEFLILTNGGKASKIGRGVIKEGYGAFEQEVLKIATGK